MTLASSGRKLAGCFLTKQLRISQSHKPGVEPKHISQERQIWRLQQIHYFSIYFTCSLPVAILIHYYLKADFVDGIFYPVFLFSHLTFHLLIRSCENYVFL